MTPQRLGARADVGLLLVRLVFGIAFVLHGLPKLHRPTSWASAMVPGTPPWLQAIAASAEFVGGAAIAVGALTPLFAFLIGCNMVVAIFLVQLPHGAPFVRTGPGASFELPAIYLATAFWLALVGPGAYSLDAALFKGGGAIRTSGRKRR